MGVTQTLYCEQSLGVKSTHFKGGSHAPLLRA